MTRERPCLLVVDDQPTNIRVLYEIFGADHEVLMATGGAQAVELCRRAAPDLVLLDVAMPDLDGYEVCRRLKADPLTREIPVIFVTGSDTAEDETRGLEAGAVDFISKPVNPAVVRARVRTHLTLKSQADQLRNLAFVDGLTGLANRRRFEAALASEYRICARAGETLALVMLDVDCFKQFNDCYGHQAGDDCLRRVAQALLARMRRPRDLVARYGGEEFVCLIPAIEADAVPDFAEELRAAVAAERIPHLASTCAAVVTVSAGHATDRPATGSGPQDLLKRADQALYAAKRAGRDRVVAAPA
ncbi:diguanylate cyclase [Solimonas soli]|uniref:diguanylate cyclase n=1 Tax=Solimonas soli TaxID=413479 RepID=UPI0004B9C3DC|nr:diguanylate cyclase [Solimonas soli]